MAEPLRVEYASEPRKLRDSAWSLVGFGLALLALAASAMAWWDLWRSYRGGAVSASYGVSPIYYVVVVAIAAACVVGLLRGRRRFAVLGVVLLVVAVTAMMVLVWRSPWVTGNRPTLITGGGP